jgi:hypothetical protein
LVVCIIYYFIHNPSGNWYQLSTRENRLAVITQEYDLSYRCGPVLRAIDNFAQLCFSVYKMDRFCDNKYIFCNNFILFTSGYQPILSQWITDVDEKIIKINLFTNVG